MAFDPAHLDLSTVPPGVAPVAHFVELYDDDADLVGSVRTFVSTGIAAGEAAVVIATPAHLGAFEAELERAVDLDAARRQGLYVAVDAAETLGLFMRGGRPDPVAFEDVVGGLLERTRAGARGVRAFGEMVALLWERGEVDAALELEELWNVLATKQSFKLFCAYASGAFDDADPSALNAMASRHSHVLVATPPGTSR
jgi:hypothetical protein